MVGNEKRLKMCELAFGGIPKTKVSDIEISRGGKSYTYLTLQELSSPEYELYFLCGTDMILSLGSWRNPDIIFALAKICYIRRENDPLNDALVFAKCEEYKEKFKAEIFEIRTDAIDISSSELRCDAEKRKSYLPQAVYDYVKKMELYK